MVRPSRRGVLLGATAALLARPFAAVAQSPLRIEITEGVIEPMPIAIPPFVPDAPGAAETAGRITQVVIDDLVGTGLFREVPRQAHLGTISNFDAPVQFADWRAINAQALVTGAVGASGGQAVVRFRLWDVFAQAPLGEGLRFDGPAASWRRLAHKVADAIYSRLTGESGYFDSRVAYVAESGPKAQRRRQVAIMDYDGANATTLTDGASLVFGPSISRNAGQILFTGYESRKPGVYLINAGGGGRRRIASTEEISLAGSFAPNGGQALISVSQGGASNIYLADLGSGSARQLTRTSAIDASPSFSPDGSQIVFESDQGGAQQIYVMGSGGGAGRRISFGEGRYATPAWSPRGDLIAFTKMTGGRFHIGVMRPDGSGEKLLTASYLDQGPTWAPNGRVLMFYRETPGDSGGPSVYTVDVTGRNLRQVPTGGFASAPSWSGLLA
ncbi:Tol-Pal system beta propeller repeat protein TolB [Amaricoccus sp.]|uniref:Tol-Pal system beta propeller repeat protein TolB n=1 Tax=Amaricoccus sp. TaxID=1872485 RepID=UPI001B48BE44|nr:Tol-Pal system beta propeller repeat protein TolB [Amaricoccus sp.]MBP7242806.1 Tol-Pal system protein TolB [Amaricoccus sp.]